MIQQQVNDFLKYQGRPPYYQVEIIGADKKAKLNNGLYDINIQHTIDEIGKTDVVLLPLTCGDFKKSIQANQKYTDWVVTQYAAGAEIVSLDVASFFLASTGLLNNRQCAVHWAAQNDFRDMYPGVHVVEDTIITDEQGIYTCGGGYSYLNLLLYIIEKHLGRPLAIIAAKMFEIDIDRKTQNQFMIFVGQKKHGDHTVLAAQDMVEHNPTETFAIEDVCVKLNVGRRSFERRFKKCTGNSITEYIQRVKVEYAKRQLETNSKTINEIIYELGYADIDWFRKLFKKHTDLSPVDYRKKYSALY